MSKKIFPLPLLPEDVVEAAEAVVSGESNLALAYNSCAGALYYRPCISGIRKAEAECEAAPRG